MSLNARYGPLKPLLVNACAAILLRVLVPYTLVDSGERYRYVQMSVFFPVNDCPSFHCFRIAPPLFTSLLPLSLADSFIVLGVICQVLAAVMLWYLAEYLYGSRVAWFAVAWFWTTWGSVQNFFDPLLITDPVQMFWSLACLYLLVTGRFVAALPMLAAGAAVKETVLLVPLVFGLYTFLAKDDARHRIVWLAVLVAVPIVTWLLLRIALSSWFGYVTYEDESYVRATYLFGVWLPGLGPFPKNLTVAGLYLFGSFGAAWILGALGLRQSSRRQWALTATSVPAMVFLAFFQVPDRALASFPWAVLLPAAIVLARLPIGWCTALLAANLAFTLRMDASVPWLPRSPVLLAVLLALAAISIVIGKRSRRELPSSESVAEPRRRGSVAWGTLGLVVCMWLAGVFAWRTWLREPPLRLTLPTDTLAIAADDAGSPAVAVAPDGVTVAFVAQKGADTRSLWIRRLSESAARVVADSEGASEPFWSPDSRAVAFFAGGSLRTFHFATGRVERLADAPRPRGGTWSRRGVILFVPAPDAGIVQVAATGGAIIPVMRPVPNAGVTYSWPSFLPDGDRFFFVAVGPDADRHDLVVGQFGATKPILVSVATDSGAYAAPNMLFFVRDTYVYLAPFDERRLMVFRPEFRIASYVAQSPLHRTSFSESATTVLTVQDPTTADRTVPVGINVLLNWRTAFNAP